MTPNGARSITAVCAVLFVGAVWFQVSKNRIASGMEQEADRQAAEVAAVRQENRALQESIRTARTTNQAAAATSAIAPEPAAETPVDRAARTAALVALVKSGAVGKLTYAAPSAYKISTKISKLSEVLGLTPEETGTLQAAADKVVAAVLAEAQVQRNGNDLTIEMRESPEARLEFNHMREIYRQVLGEAGHQAYEALGFKSALENSMNNVGLTPYSLTISRHDAEGTPTYSIVRTGSALATAAPAVAVRTAATDSAKSDVERQAAEIRIAELKTTLTTVQAGGARGGNATPTVAGSITTRAANREGLASAIGPVDGLIPAGF